MSPVQPAGPTEAFEDPRDARIAALIYREAGIVLGPAKTSLMNARLAKRYLATGARDLDAYLRLVEQPCSDELPNLVSALTTNHTHFFRENHHFEFLAERLRSDARLRSARLKVWSAGCSSGQEPYSIAITMLRAGTHPQILGTDIDAAILARAEAAVYSDAEVGTMADDLRSASFNRHPAGWQVRPGIRETVRYEQLNLHARWPFSEPFDIIFCRNVVIYFDAEAQMRLWNKFYDQLRPGGLLMIGHSERIPEPMRRQLQPLGQTIYQRAA